MLTTQLGYKLVASDLTKSLSHIAKTPEVKREGEYYLAHIKSVKSIDDFLGNDRLYRFAMKAFGLEEMTYAKAFMRKVLSEGIDSRNSFANKLSDKRYRDFAEAFNFARYNGTTTTFTRTQQGTVDRYVRQTLEADAGRSNEGVRLALYFQRNAPSVTSAYGLLADKALLKVTQVALQIPASSGVLDIARQAELIAKKLDLADLKDPVKLSKLLDRFTALWDVDNPSGSAGSSTALLISGGSGSLDVSTLSQLQNLKNGR